MRIGLSILLGRPNDGLVWFGLLTRCSGVAADVQLSLLAGKKQLTISYGLIGALH